MVSIPENKQLILFDGVCNLCNNSVQFVIKRDKKNQFLFAPLQGKAGKEVIEEFKIDTTKVDSIILYTPLKGISYKSTATLKVASSLEFPVSLMSVFLIFTAFIIDWLYDFIARNRYKWYGKKDACMMPTPELRYKFLE